MNNKRGISELITAVLVIGITLAAFGILQKLNCFMRGIDFYRKKPRKKRKSNFLKNIMHNNQYKMKRIERTA